MDATLQTVVDEASIRRVLDRYCHSVDRGSADDVAALFHAEGRLIALDDVCKGRAAVQAWYSDYHANFRAKLDTLRHKIGSVVIDFENENEARVTCYMDADCTAKGSEEVLSAIGRYDDRFVRDGDAWRFAEREIVVYRADAKLIALLG